MGSSLAPYRAEAAAQAIHENPPINRRSIPVGRKQGDGVLEGSGSGVALVCPICKVALKAGRTKRERRRLVSIGIRE
jgi:hypothetical protein